MRALLVYCHPKPDSFTAAVRDLVIAKLDATGAETQVIDLYAQAFDPVLSPDCFDCYLDEDCNGDKVASHLDMISSCDTLIFVYPTWWYGLPAILKGWLDRVLLPGRAFLMPAGPGEVIRPGLQNITRLGVFTTGGASRWLTWYIGSPGKRTLLRGLRVLCARHCRTAFAMHYLMDSSTDASRQAHLKKVARQIDKLLAGAPQLKEATA